MNRVRSKWINTESLFRRYHDEAKDQLHTSTEETANIAIDQDGIRIRRTHVYTNAADIPLPPGIRINDLAVDECDRLYLLTDRRLFIYDRVLGTVEEPGCGDAGGRPLEFARACGIGIDHDTLYIADNVTQSGGTVEGTITAFARGTLQIRWRVYSGPEGQSSLKEIVDLAAGNNGIWFIEKTGGEEYGRVVSLGRDGTYRDYETFKKPGLFTSDPSDIAIDKTGNVSVLSKNGVDFFRYDPGHPTQPDYTRYPDKTMPVPPFNSCTPKGLAISPDGRLVTGMGRTHDAPPLLLLNDSATESWEFLWSYRGPVLRLAIDSQENLYILDESGARLSLLLYTATNCRCRDQEYAGTYLSKAIDSTDATTRWHRFLLEGEFPPGTQVDFNYSVSNSIDSKPPASWLKGLPDSSAVQGEKTREGLFQENLRGRYLRFRIVLTGTEMISPVIRSVAISFPRITWVEYLPQIYQSDPISREFLERFLSLFESVFSETEFCIDHLSRYLDPEGTPGEFLEWLGSWLAVASDENWSSERKRRLISSAMDLYTKRGTRGGLEETISVYAGIKPFIIENIDRDHIDDRELIADPDNTDHLYFPPDAAMIEVPGSLFDWDEVPGNDGPTLISYLQSQLPGDRDLATAVIIKGEYPAGDPDNSVRLTLKPDAREPYSVEITRVNGKNKYSKSLPIQKRECRMLVIDPETTRPSSLRLRDILFGDEMFRFSVLLRNTPLLDETMLNTIRTIISDQKPAHTRCGLTVLEPWFALDMHTYLGVNTELRRPLFVIGPGSVLSRDTVVGDEENSGQLQIQARIGVDAKLT
jgi:phage tail-like protein